MVEKKAQFVEPADFELQVLGILWEHGPATVRQVMERLSDGKERAYTSVLSVMQVMHKKGLLELSGQRDGLAHIYRPAVTREQVAAPRLRTLVARMFAGSTRMALQHLLDAGDLDRSEIQEMRKLLDRAESRKKK